MHERIYPGTLKWDRQMVRLWYPRALLGALVFFVLLFAVLAFSERQRIEKREIDRRLGNNTEEGR